MGRDGYFGDGEEGEAGRQGCQDVTEAHLGFLVRVDEGDEGGDHEGGLGAGELQG